MKAKLVLIKSIQINSKISFYISSVLGPKQRHLWEQQYFRVSFKKTKCDIRFWVRAKVCVDIQRGNKSTTAASIRVQEILLTNSATDCQGSGSGGSGFFFSFWSGWNWRIIKRNIPPTRSLQLLRCTKLAFSTFFFESESQTTTVQPIHFGSVTKTSMLFHPLRFKFLVFHLN